MIGKRNSGFEIADGLVPWAKQVILVSPRPVAADVLAVSTVRVRYLQPYEDAVLGRRHVRPRRRDRADREDVGRLPHPRERDDASRRRSRSTPTQRLRRPGFRTPLRDLPDLGCSTVKQGVLPALTHHWESATVPGIYFAGNATQAAAGLRKHGVGSASGTVSGFRYNARLLARHIAEHHFGQAAPRPALERDDVVPVPRLGADPGARSSGPRRPISRGSSGSIRDAGPTNEGIQPLAAFLDEGERNALAVAVEMDDQARIYPALYLRGRGRAARGILPASSSARLRGGGVPRPARRSRQPGARLTPLPPARLALWAFLVALPVVGLWVLLAAPRLDVLWENHPGHFWLVLAAAAVNAVLAYATGEAARRRGDSRLFLISLAFLVSLRLPGPACAGDARSAPGRKERGLRDRDRRSASWLAGALAALSTRAGGTDIRRLQPLRAAGRSVGLVVWAAWSRWPHSRRSTRELPAEVGSPPLIALAAVGVLLYGYAGGALRGRLWRARRRLFPLAVVTAFALLAEAMLAIALLAELARDLVGVAPAHAGRLRARRRARGAAAVARRALQRPLPRRDSRRGAGGERPLRRPPGLHGVLGAGRARRGAARC